MVWNVPGRCDTERAAAEFLCSPALDKIKIEHEWYSREQIAAKLTEWSCVRMIGPAPEYRELLDGNDPRDLDL
jgi:hypothetical protein